MLIRIFIFAVAILMIFRTSGRFRDKDSRMIESFAWLFLWAFFGLVAIVPEITNYLANWFGVGRGADFVLYIAVIVLFWLISKVYFRVERFDRILTDLVRHIALTQTGTPEKKSDVHNDDAPIV